MLNLLSILGLGLLLGLKHALDADHVVAVSTITSQTKSLKKAARIGAFWGLGHTTTLLIAGGIVLAFGLTIPARLGLGFEFIVGLMLVVLGGRVLWRIRKDQIHIHPHQHDGEAHVHLHAHANNPSHQHAHMSFAVGMVHGLAGSAALMLLVLATVRSLPLGILYILIFGLGTMLGMAVVTILISLPFLAASRMHRLHMGLSVTAGLASIAIGCATMAEIGMVQELFT
ncbi:MAG: urease accessory protein UreH [Patescibacteria group bacterium]